MLRLASTRPARANLAAALALAVTAAVLAAPGADAAPAPAASPAPVVAHFAGEGFDKCDAPSTADMRSWLGSSYRAVNIYFGGVNRYCDTQPQLTPQWVSTVTGNGWSLIPTYIGLQSKCQGAKTQTFGETNAAEAGTSNADDAVAGMQALGLGAGNPVYFDLEPFNTSNDSCRRAAITFVSAWTTEIHAQGYLSGLYAHPSMGLKPLVNNTDPKPDDIWWPHYDGVDSVTQDAPLAPGAWDHHRIHQYMNSHDETYNGVTFEIDNDAVDADVVGAVTPEPPSGPPYVYAASPPVGTKLKERSTPTTQADNKTGVSYSYGTALPVECQAAGEEIHGNDVWDRLSDGGYVADIHTTTTGGLTFTSGLPRCDTVPPTTTVDTPTPATIWRGHTFRWTSVDAAPDGQATSGIGTYDVRYRSARWDGGFGGWTEVDGLTVPQTRLPLDAGHQYCVEVRATDRSFNTGPWSDEQCIARALDDRALQAKTDGWTLKTGRHFYFHTVTRTYRAGQKLKTHRAHLAQVGVVFKRCPRCGDLEVYAGWPKPAHRIGSVSMRGPRHRHVLTLLPAFSYRTKPVFLVTTAPRRSLVDGLVVLHRA